MKKYIKSVTIILAMASMSSLAQAGNKVSNLEFELSTMVTTPTLGVFNKGKTNEWKKHYEVVVQPQSGYCVKHIFTPEIYDGWPITDEVRLDGSKYVQTRKAFNGYVGGQTAYRSCTLSAIVQTTDGEDFRLYRDVKTQLSLHEKRLTVSGGLGVFGALLNTVTLGLSNALFSVADAGSDLAYGGVFRTNLQTSFEYAVKKKAAPAAILNDLVLLQCQIEAAQLASQACENSNVADHSKYLGLVKNTYYGFVSKYNGKER